MKLTDKQVKEWTSFVIRENRLPSSKIPCNKCEGSATLVHGNLLKRVIKFKGVENLLKSFECRKCHNATKKQTKEIKRKIKKEKKQNRRCWTTFYL